MSSNNVYPNEVLSELSDKVNSINVSPTQGFSHIYDSMNNAIGTSNPLVLIILSLIILVYFIIFSYLGYNINYQEAIVPNRGLSVIEIIMWGLLIFLVLINGIQYFFKIDINAGIHNLFHGTPQVDVEISPEEKLVERTYNPKKNEDDSDDEDIEEEEVKNTEVGEVFNIPGNEYTYTDAKALCKAYGSKLATYSQIENAYKSGAEWCNYGWSDNQMALYPTQKKTWDNLQKIKGHEHNCGRPGINGGYIKNKNVKFGVNCFGSKPKITKDEQDLMDNATPYPLTPDEIKINKLSKKYKNNLHSILLAPFNYEKWSQ